jgi:hypothetical protein
LPNGFHDAEIRAIRLDYLARTIVMEASVWLGNMDSPPEHREHYRDGHLAFEGMHFVILDPPDPRYSYAQSESLSVDLAHQEPSPAVPALDPVPRDCFVARFFVRDWNSFITITAKSASLVWTGEAYYR